jgi:ubiquinone/menaquinone biosynthesis C-methylase UbiE
MSFDPLARHYRWMERSLAGEKLQECRTRFLAEVEAPERILIFGEGAGRFLAECVRRFPTARILVVDESAKMLEQARGNLDRCGSNRRNVVFEGCDALSWKSSEQFELIATHFFLDCFCEEELERVVDALSASAKSNASWLLSDFQIPERGWMRWRAGVIHWMMYRFFRVATGISARRLVAPDALLRRNGFELRRRVESEWGLLRADWWQRGLRAAA